MTASVHQSDSADRRPGWSRPRVRAALIALWVAAVAIATYPAALVAPGPGLDSSWTIALAWAARLHLQFGTQIIWTYGPLGYLGHQNYAFFGQWLASSLALAVTHIGFIVLVAVLLARQRVGWPLWVGFALLVQLPLSSFPSLEAELPIAAVILLCLAYESPGRISRTACSVLAGSALAVLLLVKVSGLSAALALLLVNVLVALVRRRLASALIPWGAAALTFAICWWVTHQSMGSIVPFLRGSYEETSGYSSAMSLFHDLLLRGVIKQVLLGVAVVAGTAIQALWAWRIQDRRAWTAALLSLPVVVVTFKEGFVRIDAHQLIFFSIALLVQAIILLLTVVPSRQVSRLLIPASALAMVVTCGVMVAGLDYHLKGVLQPPDWPIASLGARISNWEYAAQVTFDPQTRTRFEDQSRRSLRSALPLSPQMQSRLRGHPADVLPLDVALAYAYQLEWSPSPVIQSYSAYTPYLDRADANFLSAASARQYVLYRPWSIDGRYPIFDEPAAFRTLRQDYQVVAADKNYVLLKKRAPSTVVSAQPAGTASAELGEWISVPDAEGGSIYGSVRIPLSVRGRLLNLVFQPSELHIQFRYGSGNISPVFRFIPAVAVDGLDLTARVQNSSDLANLMLGRRGAPISAFRITADRPPDFAPTMNVQFTRTAEPG